MSAQTETIELEAPLSIPTPEGLIKLREKFARQAENVTPAGQSFKGDTFQINGITFSNHADDLIDFINTEKETGYAHDQVNDHSDSDEEVWYRLSTEDAHELNTDPPSLVIEGSPKETAIRDEANNVFFSNPQNILDAYRNAEAGNIKMDGVTFEVS